MKIIVMSERKDLVAICHQLEILNNHEATNKTDFELLQYIVSTLRLVDTATSSRPQDGQLKIMLSQNSLPGSLAFPNCNSQNNKLAEATDNWENLRKFNDLLKQDHTCRRQMLLNRLDCTIESFKWKASDNHHGSGVNAKKPSLNDLIHEKYDQARKELKEEPQVSISHLMALRQTECDKLLNCIVSTKNVDCKVKFKQIQKQQSQEPNKLVLLKQIIIPDVPDRGGRPGEIRAPSKETFYQNRARGGGGARR